jgi:hypothetical protein
VGYKFIITLYTSYFLCGWKVCNLVCLMEHISANIIFHQPSLWSVLHCHICWPSECYVNVNYFVSRNQVTAVWKLVYRTEDFEI